MSAFSSLLRTDVLVIGGGPAGLAAAIALRQRGVDVTVVEARPASIDKACGEGLMPEALTALERLGILLDARDGVPFRGIHLKMSKHVSRRCFHRGPAWACGGCGCMSG